MEYTRDRTTFRTWLENAKASGKPFRCIHDLKRGSGIELLSDAEIAAGQRIKEAESDAQAVRKAKADAAKEKLAALGITPEDLLAALRR